MHLLQFAWLEEVIPLHNWLACLNNILDFPPPCYLPGEKLVLDFITIQGGTTYTEVAQFLMGKQGALTNLPPCPQFTVPGAIATATHGSGV
jgi:FAD/FMN-containing dehydrogenase